MTKFFVKLLKVQNLLLIASGIYLIEFISHLIQGGDDAHAFSLHFISCIMSLGLWFTVRSSDSLMDGYKAVINSQETIIESLEELYALRTNMYNMVKEHNDALGKFAKDVKEIVNPDEAN